MELSLNALVERLDEQFFQRATRAWRVASGTQRDVPRLDELGELKRQDAWQAVNEVVDSPRVDEAKRARLTLLKRHLARAFVEAQREEATAKRAHFVESHTFFAAAKTWTPLEASRELPKLASRESRLALASELSLQLTANPSTAAHQLDLGIEALHALKLTPESYLEVLHGRAIAPRLEHARAMLNATAAAHADLLGYALKKVDPQLTARTARFHDAERATLAPWLFESFRREDLQHAVSRTLTDLNLSPNADGRLTVDTDSRNASTQHVFELRVPDQIRLLLAPDMGIETYATWLSNWGLALHRANVGRTLPFVERRLGDSAVLQAVGLLFESCLLDEGWLKRYLRLTASQAREAARAFAFRQLTALRRAAALSDFSLEASKRGAVSGLDDEYVSRTSTALGVEAPRGFGVFEADVNNDAALTLDAYALELVFRRELRERFNEDFWRNPATGRWLVDLASRGQRDDAAVIARSYGTEDLNPLAAANDRVAVMGL
ncbi:MAG: hypothetical protein DI536_02620 [Archangium gephyra]|uniref:Uncharacterized protein n=1 Tax=Archangium gephyra TaxID=48 RepID=A0A2W5W6G4_9BACT|nr:MAG: hypothetical protein DI536_02620 [Archangium gephyra]